MSTEIDNRGQVCGECHTVNPDPFADYRNEDGIMACSHRCYVDQAYRAHLYLNAVGTYPRRCWCGGSDGEHNADAHAEEGRW